MDNALKFEFIKMDPIDKWFNAKGTRSNIGMSTNSKYNIDDLTVTNSNNKTFNNSLLTSKHDFLQVIKESTYLTLVMSTLVKSIFHVPK